MNLDSCGKDANDSLALTPFDLAGDEATIKSVAVPETSVVLVKNPVTDAWEPPSAAPEPAPVEEPIQNMSPPEEKGGWTVSLLCAGVALVAVCLLLPLAEENHQLAYQREKLRLDQEQIKRQVEVNGEFLSKVTDDPTLAERLAERQMNFVREGTSVLDLPGGGREQTSPFLLVSLPPPNPLPAYQPLGGPLSVVGRNARVRVYVMGIGLLLLAAGVVLGGGSKESVED